jgi:exosortase
MELDVKPVAVNQSPALFAEIAEWLRHFPGDFRRCWDQLPNKGVFFPLLIAWLLLFQFVGNPTFGYIDSSSLLYWMAVSYGILTGGNSEDSHGLLIPFVVLGLLWWKRKELLALPNRLWWPAGGLLFFALALHVLAYLIQQPRISIVALYGGIYALVGLAWGPDWLRKTFFPFFLFVFCVPIVSLGEPITFPLRHLVTRIAGTIAGSFLGMDVHTEGTQLFNSAHTFQYEVAAACSGLRSFVAILVLTIIYAFVCFPQWWKRGVVILSALPLAIIGNVIRLLCIVISASIWGRSTGNYVHENTFFSLIPYVPAILGVMLLGRWLGEHTAKPPPSTPPAQPAPI